MIKAVAVTEIFCKGKGPIPDFVHLNLTYRCNLRCIYCLDDLDPENELSYKEWFRIIDELADIGVLEVVFTGGEPFVRDDLEQIVNHAFRKGFHVGILTNGTLITAVRIKHLRRPDLCSFTFNLLGSNPDVHERITQVKGSFEKIVRSIKLLRKSGIKASVSTVVMKENFDDVDNIKKLCQDLDVSFNIQVNIRPSWKGNTSLLEHQISPAQQRELILKGLYGQRFNRRYKSRTKGLCNLGWLNPAIGADGRVYPCNILRMEAGDLRKESFSRIWYNSPVFKMLRAIKREDYRCGRCRYFVYCIPCVGDMYLQEGHIRQAHPGRCQTAQLVYQLRKVR